MKCGEVPAVLRIYFRRVNEMYSHYNRAIIVDMVHAYKHTCKHEQTNIHTYILYILCSSKEFCSGLVYILQTKHVFHLENPKSRMDHIKQCFQTNLMEMF